MSVLQYYIKARHLTAAETNSMFRRSPAKKADAEREQLLRGLQSELEASKEREANAHRAVEAMKEENGMLLSTLEQEKYDAKKQIRLIERAAQDERKDLRDKVEELQASLLRQQRETERLTVEIKRSVDGDRDISKVKTALSAEMAQKEAQWKSLVADMEKKCDEKIRLYQQQLQSKDEDNRRLAMEVRTLQDISNGNPMYELKQKAEEYEQKLIQAMEQNYKIAQRVQEEKAKRDELDHALKRTRDQMKTATQRAVDLSRVVDDERSKVRKLEIDIERAKEHRIVYKTRGVSEVQDDDEDLVQDEVQYEDSDFEDEDDGPATKDESGPGSTCGAENPGKKKHAKSSTSTTSKKKKSKSSKRSSRSISASATSSNRGRPSSAQDYQHMAKTLNNKLQKAQVKNVSLFRRFADIKRARDAAESRDAAKSEQLTALSNHLEKMMALLRAEAAAKASAQEAVLDIEDQLAKAKANTAKILEEHAEEERMRKEEARRETMLAKQLELMDEKFNSLMRTHNFLRSKTEKEAKKMNTALHDIGDKLYRQTKKNDSMHAAKLNVFNNFLRMVQNISMFNQMPLPSSVIDDHTHYVPEEGENRHLHIDLQDCQLGDEGALAFINAFNNFTIHQKKLNMEIKETLDENQRILASGKLMDYTKPTSKIINVLPFIKPQVTFSINLSFNNISDSDSGAFARTLCRAIVASNRITEIDLRGNHIGRTGLRMILDALQYNRTIRAVDLSGNNVTDAFMTEYLNDSARAADRMPDLTLIAPPGSMMEAVPQVKTGMNGPHARLFRRNNTGSKRPSSAPPGPGRGIQAPFKVMSHSKVGQKLTKKQLQQDRHEDLTRIQFPPRMSAVSAVQRLITDSMTKVVAKNEYRKPETKVDAIDPTPVNDGQPSGKGDKENTKTLPRKSLRPKTALAKSASAAVLGAMKTNIREKRRLPPKRPVSAETMRRMGSKPGEKEALEASKLQARIDKEKARIKAEMPAVTELREGEIPTYGGEYAKERFWHAFARARAGKSKSLLNLLADGMPIDAREPGSGDTMLMCATHSGNPSVIKTLIRRGADVMARNNRGWTPLHCAVGGETPQPEITNILMDNGAKVEGRDSMGVTALQLAVEQASDDIICRLIEGGANIKTQDDHGRSVLHRVASVGDKETADLIMTLGAKAMLNVPDIDGRCPASYAERHDQFEFLQYLQSLGGILETNTY